MRVRGVVGLLLCGTAVSACVFLQGGDAVPQIDGEQSTELSMRDAAGHADSILSDTVTSIQPAIEWDHQRARESTCYEDPRDLPYETGTVRRGVVMTTVISPDRREEISDRVGDFWESEGFSVQRGETVGGYPTLTGETGDGFQLRFSFNAVDQLQVTVVSPCFEEVEVAPPSSGADYDAESSPSTPDVHSDYWSR